MLLTLLFFAHGNAAPGLGPGGGCAGTDACPRAPRPHCAGRSDPQWRAARPTSAADPSARRARNRA